MENRRRKRITFADLRDRWTISLISFTCILIAVLDFLGIFDNVPLFSGKISNFTLFLVALLTGYVAFTQPEKQETFFEYISDGLNRISDSLNNSSTVTLKARPFANIAAALDYAKKQIGQAKQRIIVVYPEMSPNFYQAVPAGVFYKQIFVVEPENLPKYQNILLASLMNMPVNYSYAGLRCPKEWLQCFVIVDDKELIILSDFLPLTTRNDQFIRVYRESFYAMWDKAVKLKTNDIVDTKRIQVILAPTPKPLEIPADLEECVKNCLKAHERIKNRAQEINA